MPDYQNSKIYAIRTHQSNEVYIGSTTLSLTARMGEHRRQYRFYKGENKTKATKSQELLKYEDAYIELIEEFPCKNKEQLLKREGEIIRTTEHCVNRCISGRTNLEWRNDNADRLKKYQKDYDDKRKEQKKLYNKMYRERRNGTASSPYPFREQTNRQEIPQAEISTPKTPSDLHDSG